MSRGRAFVALLLASWLLGQAVGGPSAHAHAWAEWYQFGRWTTTVVGGVDTDKTVQWKFVDNFPSAHRNAVVRASTRWNGRTTMDFDYKSADASSLRWGSCGATYQDDRVGWQDITTGAVAQSYLCMFPGTTAMYSFTTRYDALPVLPWYSGVDGDVPVTHLDVEAVASHEFGHATGRATGGDGAGHFGDHWAVCPGDPQDLQPYSGRHTMCQTVDGGRSAMRTLEAHDLDVFEGAY